MKKNVSINPTLKDVPEKLRNVRQLELNVSPVILDFVEYMVKITENVLSYKSKEPYSPNRLWTLAMDANDNIKAASIAYPKVPDSLMDEKTVQELICHREDFLTIVNKISSLEFFNEFQTLGNPIF